MYILASLSRPQEITSEVSKLCQALISPAHHTEACWVSLCFKSMFSTRAKSVDIQSIFTCLSPPKLSTMLGM